MKTVNKNNVCEEFVTALNDIVAYKDKCKSAFADNKKYLSYCYEYSIIMTYKAFERFLLRIMISCLNHDHSVFEKKNSISLGRHINDDVCEFLITKGGFFDFKGRDGLCKVINNTIGKDHVIAKTIKNNDYKNTIEQLCAIRNFAAHNSRQSKAAAAEAFKLKRISSAGSCLKQNGRFDSIIAHLIDLSNDIKSI